MNEENHEHLDSVFADYEDEYLVFELFTINLKHSVYITAWMTFESMSKKIYEDIATKKVESKSSIKENTKFIDKLIKHLKSKPWKEVIVKEDLIDDIDRYKKVRNNIIHNKGQVQEGDLEKTEYKDNVIKSYRMDFSLEYLHEYVKSISSFLEQMYAYKKNRAIKSFF